MKTEHTAWQQMPSSMLRHRAMQQCACLAFGITVPECKPSSSSVSALPGAALSAMHSLSGSRRLATQSHAAILKERLAQSPMMR